MLIDGIIRELKLIAVDPKLSAALFLITPLVIYCTAKDSCRLQQFVMTSTVKLYDHMIRNTLPSGVKVRGGEMFARSLKRWFSWFVPHGVFIAQTRYRHSQAKKQWRPTEVLFSGDDQLFKSAMDGCSTYGEYGCGESTIWVARNSRSRIISVDTSLEWIDRVRDALNRRDDISLVHVDLGLIGDWGRPKTYDRLENFSHYFNAIWEFKELPDLVLIDGRFRVACWLASYLRAAPGTTILFDDYVGRSEYHVVELVDTPVDRCGRQVKFVVPERIDRKLCSSLLRDFTFVMD